MLALFHSENNLLKDSKIIVAGLPAHISRVLQPLDVGVIGPFKESFRRLLSRRTITSSKDARDNIFAACELLCSAYYHSATAQNAVGGFQKSDAWSAACRGCNLTQF